MASSPGAAVSAAKPRDLAPSSTGCPDSVRATEQAKPPVGAMHDQAVVPKRRVSQKVAPSRALREETLDARHLGELTADDAAHDEPLGPRP